MLKSLPHLIIILLIPFITPSSSSHQCSLPPPSQPPCPPFTTTPPPYPFSTIQGCGHPSFHLNCTTTFSLLSINNLSFSLLNYDPTTFSLLLSPLSLPPHPISLSNTPFSFSTPTCSRLSLLKPCSLSPPPNCSTLSPFYCSLLKNPSSLLHGCQPNAKPKAFSDQRCQNDILGFLDKFLKFGVELVFDPESDHYFTSCNACKTQQVGVCGFNSSHPNKPFVCFVDRKPFLSTTHHKRTTVLSSILIILCLVCFMGIAYIVFRNKKIGDNLGLEDPTTLFLHRHRSASLLPPVFTYEELEASTNRFDPKRKIGDGGFGSVYVAQLYDGRIAAVKYLHRHPATAAGTPAISTKSFCNEILILSSIEHPNLVKLHGYCSDPRGLLLVYDFISNGTLADHLHGSRKKGRLSWLTRVDIALQIAIAVEYLHCTVQPPVCHRDITTANIFVDRDMRVRVGDFGLSRLLVYPDRVLSGELSGSPSGCVWTGPQGTPGYLDPDYYKSFRLTEKSDVYSFGVVLLELITGMKAVDQRREKREMALVDMAVAKIQLGLLDQVVDPVLADEGGVVGESVAVVAELAFRCVAADKDDRPDAREMVVELRRIWNWTRGVKGSNANVVVVPAGAES